MPSCSGLLSRLARIGLAVQRDWQSRAGGNLPRSIYSAYTKAAGGPGSPVATVTIAFGRWRYAMRHFQRGFGEFGEQPARPLYVMGKLLHCLFVEREQEFRASPLALLPQGKRLLHGVFFGVKPSLSTTRPAKAFWSGVRCTSTLSE